MSNPIDDGAPAFPTINKTGKIGDETHYLYDNVGMSLRDYFAAAFLSGRSETVNSSMGKNGANQIATQAYRLADAMLKARKGDQ